MDSRARGRGLQYLVKWVGYNESENSWESATNLKNAGDKVKAFHQKHPAAPRPIGKFVFATYQWEELPQLTDGLNPKTLEKPVVPDWQDGKKVGKESKVMRGRRPLEGGY